MGRIFSGFEKVKSIGFGGKSFGFDFVAKGIVNVAIIHADFVAKGIVNVAISGAIQTFFGQDCATKALFWTRLCYKSTL